MSSIGDSFRSSQTQSSGSLSFDPTITEGGKMGDKEVTTNSKPSIGRSILNFFSGIGDKITSLKDRVVNYFAEKSAARKEAALGRAADNLVNTMVQGNVTPKKMTSLLNELQSSAKKTGTDDPTGKAVSALRERLSTATPEQQKAVRTHFAMDGNSAGLMREFDSRVEKHDQMMQGLEEMGLAGEGDRGDSVKARQNFKGLVDGIQHDCRQYLIGNLQEKMPSGVTIQDNGVVSGTSTISQVPDVAPNLAEIQGMSIGDGVKAIMSDALKPERLTDLGGQKVITQAPKDFFRMDLEMPTSQGTFKTRDDPETGEAERNLTVVQNLRDYAGSDNATTVLSSVLVQTTLRPFHDSIATEGGDQALLTFAAKREGTYKDDQGVSHDLGLLTNYGGAKLKLDKMENGDFRVKVSWTMYPDHVGRGFAKESMPLSEGGVLKSEFSIEMVVDKAAADRGELVLTCPTDPTVTFSGKLF
ncbi:MAG: hypothetical protein V4662_23415 [Verrucomicrobiota bacterium]